MQRRQLLTLGITTTVAAGIGGIASRKAFEADLDRAKARLHSHMRLRVCGKPI